MPDERCDVVVIGGGAVGLCAAFSLSREGIRTTIIERHEPGSGCSLHNAGLIVPSHFVPLASPGLVRQGLRWILDRSSPFAVRLRLDPALIGWLWRFWRSSTEEIAERSMPLLRDLSHASLALIEQLSAAEGVECEFRRNGLLMLFRTEAGRAACEHEARLAGDLGIEARLLTHDQFGEVDPGVPFRATGGVYFPGDAQLVPQRFVENLAARVEQAGVAIRRNTELVGFNVDAGRIVGARTTGGTIAAREFVLAGGAWSAAAVRPLGVRLPLQPGKGYSVTIPRPERCPSIPSILTEARVAVTPFERQLRLAGTLELSGLDLSIDRRRVQAIVHAVPDYLGDLPVDPALDVQPWSGLRPCTPDGLPYLGRFSRYPNLIAATGHAMLGITLAPITGRLVADLVTGRPLSIDIRALSPDRFEG